MPRKKDLIIPVFISHRGCPNRCVFCNQVKISGSSGDVTLDGLREYLEKSLGPDTAHATVAFYGGSFTGLPKGEQEGYLNVAGEFVGRGFASGIRLSTRPDYMDTGIARFLKGMGVTVVELGAQSMEPGALLTSKRGHTADDTESAARAVKDAGIMLGLQVMAGLPGDSPDGFIRTVDRVVALEPEFARIYPALVLKGSELEALWLSGEYVPLGLEEAVSLSADAVERFRGAGIKVIRLGLQASESLEAAYLAGPYHPAFGHMVESEIAFRRMEKSLAEGPSGRAEFRVNPAELSVYRGLKSSNVARLATLRGGLSVSIIADQAVLRGGMEASVR